LKTRRWNFQRPSRFSFPTTGAGSNCRRPFIITGGELDAGHADLSYNKVSKVYDAPFQLKANNGIYLLDDFGRQKMLTPRRSSTAGSCRWSVTPTIELPGRR